MVIREYLIQVIDDRGVAYTASAHGEERADGTWEGWLEFNPIDSGQTKLRTGQETSQPNRTAVEYWAEGLEPVYLDGALARAQGRLP